ncbi:YhcN/YlaJ family sporulation lipoprotein [Effusibacillus consociatus]|uniref:YhcN/YlaJ family sporulation lipoprotein n=1 Tax=Effusibacillus consociatus TaxID=1117041 RepID=A0ABV9Q5P4_9BACL
MHGNKIRMLTVFLLATALMAGCTPAQPRAQRYPGAQTPAPGAPVPPPPPSPAPDTAPRVQTTDTPVRDAQNIANALVGKHNISRANVLVTDRTAYVAVDIPYTGRSQAMTDRFKDEVANEVRRVDPSIQRVYVSADADVFDRFQGYTNDIRAGRPIQGVYERFTEFVQRIWPQQR